jgi:hypothetical protein
MWLAAPCAPHSKDDPPLVSLRLALLASVLCVSPALAGGQHDMAMAAPPSVVPVQPGQAAFGAMQEIVAILQADPGTDWSRVDVDALRQHLIDMDEVTMRAQVQKTPIDKGLRMEVTGTGRTLDAIRRMVPNHARHIDGLNGWAVRATPTQTGVTLTVTAPDARGAQMIRGLGFMGIMVLGSHHQPHHLAIAQGRLVLSAPH